MSSSYLSDDIIPCYLQVYDEFNLSKSGLLKVEEFKKRVSRYQTNEEFVHMLTSAGVALD